MCFIGKYHRYLMWIINFHYLYIRVLQDIAASDTVEALDAQATLAKLQSSWTSFHEEHLITNCNNFETSPALLNIFLRHEMQK